MDRDLSLMTRVVSGDGNRHNHRIRAAFDRKGAFRVAVNRNGSRRRIFAGVTQGSDVWEQWRCSAGPSSSGVLNVSFV